MAVGWLVGGWGLVGVPVLSVQFNRSILSVQAGVPGSRSRQAFMACVGWRLAVGWRLVGGRGRQQEGNSAVAPHHETAKTAPNTQNSRSSSTKTSILCSKRPKMGVPEAKKAQKPRFCAREEGDLRWEEKIVASESATVAFLQITAHTTKT